VKDFTRNGHKIEFDTFCNLLPFFCQDVLERKIEDLSRHLAEEKQVSRREKIHVARLHRELARYKGDKEIFLCFHSKQASLFKLSLHN
jgi:hypothetical protein